MEGPFQVTDPCRNLTLQPQEQCIVTVTTAATVTGLQQGKLTVTAPGAQVVALLTWTADPLTDLVASVTAPGFGSVPVGQASPPVEVKISNPGSDPTAKLTLTFTNVAASEYEITDNGCTAPLAGGASCRVLIVFKPTMPGLRPASLFVGGGHCGGAGSVLLDGTGR